MVNKYLTFTTMSLFPLKAAGNARLSARMAIAVAKIYLGLIAGGPRRQVLGAAGDGNGDWPSGGASKPPFEGKGERFARGLGGAPPDSPPDPGGGERIGGRR